MQIYIHRTSHDVSPDANRLINAATNRNQFEQILMEYQSLSSADLKSVANAYLGYSPSGTKTDIIAAMRRRQRQDELNSDRNRAQAKVII